MSTIKKRTIIVWSIIGGFILALGTFLLVWFCGASYPVYDAIARKEFAIPGLSNLVGQGLATLPENEEGYDFVMSGYMADGSASRLYVIDKETGANKYVTLLKSGSESEMDTGHFGGVAATENHILVTSGKKIVRIALADVLNAENGGAVARKDVFTVGISCSFVYAADGRMYTGEFADGGQYKTPEEHHIPVANGEVNRGFVYVYEIDESAEGGCKSSTPVQVISVRDKVQGMAVYADGITLSTSYGLADSGFFTYRNILTETTDKTVTVGGVEVPFYVLDNDNLVKKIDGPAMSEEVCVLDGRLYILNESACDKYKLFNRRRITDVYSIALEDLK